MSEMASAKEVPTCATIFGIGPIYMEIVYFESPTQELPSVVVNIVDTRTKELIKDDIFEVIF